MVKKKSNSKKKKILALPDPLFVPLIYSTYKENKVLLLNTQLKVLECLQTIENIRLLQKKKESLKKELYTKLNELLKTYYQTQGLLPILNNSLSKKVEKTIEVSVNYNNSQSSFSYSKKISQTDEMDGELREIQAKLNALNSSREFIN